MRALLQQALDALDHAVISSGGETGCEHQFGICFCAEYAAIEALRAAIAQPESAHNKVLPIYGLLGGKPPKPIIGPCGQCKSTTDPCYCGNVNTGKGIAQPENEPVACIKSGFLYMLHEFPTGMPRGATPLYAAPVQTGYVPLTQAQAEAFAHRRATKYTHRSDPTYHSYAFVPHTLMDFVADIEKAVRGKS